MSIKKRKLKNKLFAEVKIFLFSLIVLFILFSAGFVLLNFVIPKGELLSPLAKQLENRRHNQLEGDLAQNNINFDSVEVASDSSYLINLKDGGQVIISPSKNIQNQISSLQLIMSRLTIEGKRFKVLDFRYDKPVIVF